ncbi:restriction endonuclease subunit S [Finegoldia magna]|uniref:restriction endonuclease subunit S n=1 Tax=Finegoldia magna TaxID=1260 RepID=UPI001E29AC2F|nr:restriction endonuclease subunit S [Finegoldia magna]
MKDSGIEWIGEIPEDWKLTKVKHIGKYINGYPFKPSDWSDSGVPIIRIQNLTGNNSEYNYYSGPKLPEDYFIIKNNYLISWSATLGVFIWHKDKGYLNQHIFKAVPNEAVINYDYFYWIAKIFIEEIQSYMHGSAMQHVTKAVFDNFTIPLPSGKQEQIKISETLSSKIALKNSIKQSIIKEIQTLEDYKKSVITEAVTKGLDKNVEMKDSGIEWIGKIPKHWEIKNIKNLTLKSERGTSPSYIEDDTKSKVVNQATFSQGFFDKSNIKYSKIPTNNSRGLLKKGDVLIASTGGGVLGKTHFFIEDGEYVADGHITILRTDSLEQNSKILYYIFSVNYELINGILAKGSTNQTELQSEWLKNFKVPYTSINEQNQIVDYLDKKTKLIDDSIAIKQKQLEVLEEYKKSLIYEYVTGKKEVKDGEET